MGGAIGESSSMRQKSCSDVELSHEQTTNLAAMAHQCRQICGAARVFALSQLMGSEQLSTPAYRCPSCALAAVKLSAWVRPLQLKHHSDIKILQLNRYAVCQACQLQSP
jgi:hypothetical protein